MDAGRLGAARTLEGTLRRDDRTDLNPYVFVCGCPRSGTTLLQRMLDRHPSLAVVHESHFLPKPFEDLPVGVDVPLSPELVEWLRAYPRMHKLKLPDRWLDEAAEECATYGELARAMYSVYARGRGKRLAGEKTPHFVRKLPHLHGLFPWARTIHLVRDGRDVALSTLDWVAAGHGPGHYSLWAEEPIGVCALRWERNVRAGRDDGAPLGSAHYRELRYEDLITAPEEHLRDLAAFLDLPDAPEMATYYIGTRHTAGRSGKKAWLPPTQGLRDWRTQMSPRDTALFEALAGDLLGELGYERSVDTFSPEVSETAQRCREWWDARFPRRQEGTVATR